MPYYYMGDPGFFSFLKRGLGAVAGMIPGVGGVASKAIEHLPIGGVKRTSIISRVGAGAAAIAASPLIKRGVGVVTKHPILSGAAAAATVGLAGAGIEHHVMSKAQRAAAGLPRRHRRMNPCNPRALRRALRRAHTFAKFAHKVMHVGKKFKKPRGRWPRGHSRKRRSA